MVAAVKPLVAILGPTGSGKSDLAMKLARSFDGEIICADSRTIYRGMDIGTAKPSAADQKQVRHHLLDLVNPDEMYSAAQFKQAALEAVNQIRSRGNLPILVGGSGLYAYAVLYDYQFPAGARNKHREDLEGRPLGELVAKLEQSDPESAASIDLKNPRRVIRALETIGQPRQRQQLSPNTILIGLHPGNLEERIKSRTSQMIERGLVEEMRRLVDKYPSNQEVFKSPGYAEVVDCLEGRIKIDEIESLISLHTRQLAKRQLTWLRRNSDIERFDDDHKAYQFVADKLKSDRL